MSNKYNHSRIYKIQSNLTDKIYIGSTTQSLAQRLSDHVRHYNQYINKTLTEYTTSYDIIKQGDYFITLIEECNFNNKQQLFRREGELIKFNINNCVNTRIEGRTNKEYRLDNKEIIAEKEKLKYQHNKEHILKHTKQYRLDNKEIIAVKEKQFREDHKERIHDYFVQHYIEHRETKLEYAKQPYTCVCGSSSTVSHKSRHENTIYHKLYIIHQIYQIELSYYNF